MNIIEREQTKYNLLHKKPKYGGRTGRTKMFRKADDKFHKVVKIALSESDTLLDIGCGKGAFIDLFHSMYPKIKIKGCDIAEEVKRTRKDLDIDICSAHDLPYDDNTFDIVCHMDGMEHIPSEIEDQVLREGVRVSKEWIYHTTAIHEVKHHDDEYEALGLGAVHINMKTVKEWKRKFIELSEAEDLDFVSFLGDEYWIHALLRKRPNGLS